MKLFGIEIFQEKQAPMNPISMDTPSTDSSVVINSTSLNSTQSAAFASGFATSINALSADTLGKEENELITEYRNLLGVAEVEHCVDEIVNEAIVYPKDGGYAIMVNLSNLDEKVYTQKLKDSIKAEFEYVYDIMLFHRKGHDIFRRWFVDSRVNYFKNIDSDNPGEGIQSLQFIDPRKIKKVTESNRVIDKVTGKLVTNSYKEYFRYDDNSENDKQKNNLTGFNPMQTQTISILTRDSVAYAPSGLTDASGRLVIGHLHNALKIANNLKLMEDSMLIYKLSRAPERRIFYIDTGNLPKAKAEQYVKEIADKYKTRAAYDVKTGKIKNDRAFLAITEDFWLARGGNGSGTQIDTLPGGNNSGDTSEVDYFKDKLYIAMKVPKSRFEEPVGMFNAGTMITRDEVRFSRYIEKLRSSFSVLFNEILGTQLILKGIITPEEWNNIKNKVTYTYEEDNYFKEQVKAEKLGQIANYIQIFDGYVGKYFSREYFYKTVCQLNEDAIQELEEQLKSEANSDINSQIISLNNQLLIAQAQLQIKEAQDALQAPPDDGQEEADEPTAESFYVLQDAPVLSEETILNKFK